MQSSFYHYQITDSCIDLYVIFSTSAYSHTNYELLVQQDITIAGPQENPDTYNGNKSRRIHRPVVRKKNFVETRSDKYGSLNCGLHSNQHPTVLELSNPHIHSGLRVIIFRVYKQHFYLHTSTNPLEISTQNGSSMTEYLFQYDPILCIIALEDGLEITTSLNMHNANLKTATNTVTLYLC